MTVKVRKGWFALKCRPDREGSVRRAIRRQTRVLMLEHLVGRMLDPKTKSVRFRNGKRTVERTRKFDGYLILHCAPTDDLYHLLRKVADVTGLVGTEDEEGFIKPTPLLPQEVEELLAYEKEYKEQPDEARVNYSVGDTVNVKDGSFRGQSGRVLKLSGFGEPQVTVELTVLGVPAPATLRYWQVEKVS